ADWLQAVRGPRAPTGTARLRSGGLEGLHVSEHANELLLQATLQREQLAASVQNAAQRPTGQTIVMIRQTEEFRSRFNALLKALRRVIDSRPSRDAWPAAQPFAAPESDREELMRIRRDLLEQAGRTFSSEDVAMVAQSTTT